MASVMYETAEEALAALKVTVSVETRDGSKWVKVEAPMYRDTSYYLSNSFSTSFTDKEVIDFALPTLALRYGVWPASGFVTS